MLILIRFYFLLSYSFYSAILTLPAYEVVNTSSYKVHSNTANIDNSTVCRVVEEFIKIGDVSVKKLNNQPELPCDENGSYIKSIDMPCFYGVFPVQNSNLSLESMPVFVDKNFREIFTFIKDNSWRENDEHSATKSTVTLVDGPPGSGTKDNDCNYSELFNSM